MVVQFTIKVEGTCQRFDRWLANKPDKVTIVENHKIPLPDERIHAEITGRAVSADLSVWTSATDVLLVEKHVLRVNDGK